MRLGIAARRALQRFDEAAQRGERRAQLVAGIGDEIRAHPLDAPRLGDIAEGEHEELLAGIVSLFRRCGPHDIDRVRRHAFGMLDLVRFAGGDGFAHHVENAGRAQPRRKIGIGRNGAERLFGGAIL